MIISRTSRMEELITADYVIVSLDGRMPKKRYLCLLSIVKAAHLSLSVSLYLCHSLYFSLSLSPLPLSFSLSFSLSLVKSLQIAFLTTSVNFFAYIYVFSSFLSPSLYLSLFLSLSLFHLLLYYFFISSCLSLDQTGHF